ncbi:NAD(P)H-binding protein [Glycomyces sp. NPDC046736]|uniref:NAD(P)H-binding protein n=1 Tax=Glycomyces sp. NPDC046736 TaxID=3155615 RepID=UPI003408510F
MIVVTGATGNIGRPLVAALAARGEEVVALSRGEAEFPAGVTHRKADLADSSTLDAAFAGADRMLLLPRSANLDLTPVVKAAKAAGVKRIVLVSSQRAVTREGADQDEPPVVESGLEWTLLRPGGFASNAYLWADSIRAERRFAAPFGDVGLPVVDPVDIAEVAAAALTEDGHAGKAYVLTGPELITPRGQAAAIAEAIGEPVEFVEQTREEAAAAFGAYYPPEVVEGSLEVLGNPNEAEQTVSGDVERVLGRAPHTFAAWAKRNAAAFR